jgi:hypothetical protein
MMVDPITAMLFPPLPPFLCVSKVFAEGTNDVQGLNAEGCMLSADG